MDEDPHANIYKWLDANRSQLVSLQTTFADIDDSSDAGTEEHRKKRRRVQTGPAVQRGMHRHLMLIVDFSKTMLENDLKPTRLVVTVNACIAFIQEFFDQNPIAQLGVIITRDGVAEKLTELGGNPTRHIDILREKSTGPACASGEPSLQNALQSAITSLQYIPKYGCREVVIIMASLTTTDPGSILDTVIELKSRSIRCSVVSLTAELFIHQRLAEHTGGTNTVALSEQHVQQLLLEHVRPPPAPPSTTAQLVKMGFPKKIFEPFPTFCVCHKELKKGGYICPQCSGKYCELPTDCSICGLTLLSSPHLARSYHHMFPISQFVEERANKHCSSCRMKPAKSETMFRCPTCNSCYCAECDNYIHESLHNCPGCEMLPAQHTGDSHSAL